MSCDFLGVSKDARGEETAFGLSLAAIVGLSMLSVEARLGASILWRGLACVEDDVRSGFWPAALAAMALANRSWRRSLVRVEAVLEGAVSSKECQS